MNLPKGGSFVDGLYSTLVSGAPEVGVEALGVSSVSGRVHLPASEDFLRADFARSGPDLLIQTPGGGHYVVPGYFMAEAIPFLETFDGAVLSPKLVSALAGPQVIGMVAQAAQPGQAALQNPGLGAPIGQVNEAEGGVDVRHVDGSQSTLSVGDPIFQGDVLETGPASHVGVAFVDDTIFSLDESGRMVVDEMVYDPDAQTGVFNAQVVQGVFSFVSGQVAKTSPDGMVISTPTNTIGIRGTTGAGRAGGEGTPNRISLLPDPDGNVGEMIVSNGAGFQVLNKAGASLTVFSFNAPMAPPVILSSVQIQQAFGASLSKLVQVVARKAEADAGRAQEQAQKAGEEAQQAEAEAQQAEEESQQADEAAQQADAEAEAEQAALAEAEAALKEAEAAGDEEALAEAKAAVAEAQAKAQAAEEKAQAEAAKAEEAKLVAAEKASAAEVKVAEAEKAQVVAAKAAEFTALAKSAATAQIQAFDAVMKNAPQQEAVDKAVAEAAAKAATAAAASKAAADAAAKAATDAAAKAAAEAAAKAAAAVIAAEEAAKAAAKALADQLAQQVKEAEAAAKEALDAIKAALDIPEINSEGLVYIFDETKIAGNNGGTLSGTSNNTNFYFQWRGSADQRYISGNYTITDAGGINQLSLDNLNDALVRVEMTTLTSGIVRMWEGFGAVEDNLYTDVTVTFSKISQFLLSDVRVSSFATTDYATDESISGDVLVLETLGAGEVGYVIVGTSANDTFIIDQTFDGAIIFGKGNDNSVGGDYFSFESLFASDLTAIGGITNTDNVDTNSDGIPDTYLNTFDYTNIGYTAGQNGILAQLGGSSYNDVYVTDLATQSVLGHELWDVSVFIASTGNDVLHVTSGNYNSIQGGDGADTITVYYGAKFYELLGGVGDDTITVDASALTNATAINGGAGTNGLTLNTYVGGTFSFSNDVVINFSTVLFDASSAGSGVTVTDTAVGNVTFVGSSSVDIITGGSGRDTITGGSGADIFKYIATTDGGGLGDLIQDFTISEGDKFNFLDTAFNGANVSGVLDANNFISGAGTTAASTATQYFIYNSTDSVLYYDADGSGPGAAVTIADMVDGTSFSNAGIVMV